MSVVVTGAGGFLGRHLVARLRERGVETIAVGRGGAALEALRSGGARIVASDYGAGALGFVEGARAIVHLAGRRMGREDAPRGLSPFLEPNLALTERLLDAALAAGAERFVFASSIAVYSVLDRIPYEEEGSTHPINAYGLSKRMGEELIALKTRGAGLSAASLRFSALFGAGERTTGALMRFCGQAGAGQSLSLRGQVNFGVDQLYVEDAVDAILAALDRPQARGAFNIGGGRAWSVREMANAANAVYENSAPVVETDVDEGEAPRPFMTTARARDVLGWTPAHTLETGLRAMRAAARSTP